MHQTCVWITHVSIEVSALPYSPHAPCPRPIAGLRGVPHGSLFDTADSFQHVRQ